jgi:LPS export ABC transporter protein LptC
LIDAQILARFRAACAALLLVSGLAGVGCRPSSQEATASSTAIETPTQVLKSFEMNDVQNSFKTMTLVAPEARIYDTLQVADVDQPVLVFYKAGRFSSRLTAPNGRVRTDTHDVETWGGVTVVSADSSTLTTERLRYDSKNQKIYSNDAVRLEKPDSITEGIGLETDPELHTVKIGHQKVHFKKGMAQ